MGIKKTYDAADKRGAKQEKKSTVKKSFIEEG